MSQIIISEKPNAAAKIASALGLKEKISNGKVYLFRGEINKKTVYVVPAVGHLFGLSSTKKGYPVFEVEWIPTYEKDAKFSKPYYNQLKSLVKEADELIVATDYDVEGEVIGYNIVRFIFKKQDAKRMKFSTLTTDELKEAYKNASPHLDFGQAEAGLARHSMDFFYGISLTKAASSALTKTINFYKTLSIGRVQGPALELLSTREREISSFVSTPYWQIFADFDIKGNKYEAIHEKERFTNEEEATSIYKKVKDKDGTVEDVKITKQKALPPFPFDLTTLQTEAWRTLKISPKRTLEIAQNLYTGALISYPRTSSQKLPISIGYKKIMSMLSQQPKYAALISKIKKSVPVEGKKDDPAHPAIYPTGELPRSISDEERAIYDLIVTRFLTCFGEIGERETTTIKFLIESEPFILQGTRTSVKGWMEIYAPYLKREEIELPQIKKGEIYSQKTTKKKGETKPPARYTQASIIRELEKRNLGTKATRASIVDILYQRGYLKGVSIQVTPLGLKVAETFEKYAPAIVSEDLTRKFEEDMDKIREGKLKQEDVLTDAKKVLVDICSDFDSKKEAIGKSLAEGVTEAKKEEQIANTIMKCPKCNEGNLRIITSKKSGKRFIGCSNYPKCANSMPLPQYGGIKILEEKCSCGFPFIYILNKGKDPWKICVNKDCPEKQAK